VLGRQSQGFLDADDAEGLVLRSVQADFECSDFTVQPVLALVIARAAVKEVSDVGFLQARRSNRTNQWSVNTRPAVSRPSATGCPDCMNRHGTRQT